MDEKELLETLLELLELQDAGLLTPEQQERLSALLEPLIEDTIARHEQAFKELAK